MDLPVPTGGVAAASNVTPAVADLLHCLGYVYLRHGQARRAAVLLMVAGRASPDRPAILRTLAAALVEAGLGERAAPVLDRLAALDPAEALHPMVRLLRARALLQQGHVEQARHLFNSQSDAAPPPNTSPANTLPAATFPGAATKGPAA